MHINEVVAGTADQHHEEIPDGQGQDTVSMDAPGSPQNRSKVLPGSNLSA